MSKLARMTHIGTILSGDSRANSAQRNVKLRQTKLYWVDSRGLRYHKADGTGVGKLRWRLDLDSIQESEKARSVRSKTATPLFLGLHRLGFLEYLAARKLLISRMLLQGVEMAASAVEKYMKAVLALRGNECNTHKLTGSLLRALANWDPRLSAKLNHDFLQFLEIGYSLRYLDSAKVGTSIHIAKRKTLAELDFTVSEFERRFRLRDKSGEIETNYRIAVKEKDPSLWEANYILLGKEKHAYIEGPDDCYELRVLAGGNLIEATYEAQCVVDDGEFVKDALIPRSVKGENEDQYR